MVVTHSRGSYPVEFCNLADVKAKLSGASVITDENLARHYPELVSASSLVLTPGEHTKSVTHLERCVHWMADQRLKRKDRVVALGGGVIGDLVGFAAATYMRGIAFTQVPTSLLAMVDSSVGGKVGIDLPQGKNLMGAFWPPAEVLIAQEFLKTLPQQHLTNGMAEVWKYGFIMDKQLLVEAQAKNWATLIPRCIELKRQVVEEDEFETKGLRATLNFGHTIGHAIEKELNYGILHGEAISIGMVLEAQISVRRGLLGEEAAHQLQHYLGGDGLPTQLPKDLSSENLISAMRSDKKVESDSLAMSLLTGLGECKLFTDLSVAEVMEVFENS